MLAKVPAARVGSADHSREGGRLLLDERDKALRGRIEVGTQIVMLLEESPSRTMHAANFERNAWASLKRPPRELVRGRIVDPVGIEPVDDVIVAGDGNELFPRGADRPGNRSGPDSGDRAIDDRRELINYSETIRFGERARHPHAELFAGREGVVRSQPGRRA
jgi:hypothetical protein